MGAKALVFQAKIGPTRVYGCSFREEHVGGQRGGPSSSRESPQNEHIAQEQTKRKDGEVGAGPAMVEEKPPQCRL